MIYLWRKGRAQYVMNHSALVRRDKLLHCAVLGTSGDPLQRTILTGQTDRQTGHRMRLGLVIPCYLSLYYWHVCPAPLSYWYQRSLGYQHPPCSFQTNDGLESSEI